LENLLDFSIEPDFGPAPSSLRTGHDNSQQLQANGLSKSNFDFSSQPLSLNTDVPTQSKSFVLSSECDDLLNMTFDIKASSQSNALSPVLPSLRETGSQDRVAMTPSSAMDTPELSPHLLDISLAVDESSATKEKRDQKVPAFDASQFLPLTTDANFLADYNNKQTELPSDPYVAHGQPPASVPSSMQSLLNPASHEILQPSAPSLSSDHSLPSRYSPSGLPPKHLGENASHYSWASNNGEVVSKQTVEHKPQMSEQPSHVDHFRVSDSQFHLVVQPSSDPQVTPTAAFLSEQSLPRSVVGDQHEELSINRNLHLLNGSTGVDNSIYQPFILPSSRGASDDDLENISSVDQKERDAAPANSFQSHQGTRDEDMFAVNSVPYSSESLIASDVTHGRPGVSEHQSGGLVNAAVGEGQMTPSQSVVGCNGGNSETVGQFNSSGSVSGNTSSLTSAKLSAPSAVLAEPSSPLLLSRTAGLNDLMSSSPTAINPLVKNTPVTGSVDSFTRLQYADTQQPIDSFTALHNISLNQQSHRNSLLEQNGIIPSSEVEDIGWDIGATHTVVAEDVLADLGLDEPSSFHSQGEEHFGEIEDTGQLPYQTGATGYSVENYGAYVEPPSFLDYSGRIPCYYSPITCLRLR